MHPDSNPHDDSGFIDNGEAEAEANAAYQRNFDVAYRILDEAGYVMMKTADHQALTLDRDTLKRQVEAVEAVGHYLYDTPSRTFQSCEFFAGDGSHRVEGIQVEILGTDEDGVYTEYDGHGTTFVAALVALAEKL